MLIYLQTFYCDRKPKSLNLASLFVDSMMINEKHRVLIG